MLSAINTCYQLSTHVIDYWHVLLTHDLATDMCYGPYVLSAFNLLYRPLTCVLLFTLQLTCVLDQLVQWLLTGLPNKPMAAAGYATQLVSFNTIPFLSMSLCTLFGCGVNCSDVMPATPLNCCHLIWYTFCCCLSVHPAGITCWTT